MSNPSIPSPEESSRGSGRSHAPKGVEQLGLQLPVTEADVKQAYFKQAQATHPDHGGKAEDFLKVQEAFEEALEFAKRNGKRLPWIGAQMELYVVQRDAIELVEQWGGSVEVESLDWLQETVGGDFTQLADRLKAIELSGRPIADEQLGELLREPRRLPYLESVTLNDTRVSDASAAALAELPSLKRVDLRGTQTTLGLRRQLARVPGVERVEGASLWGDWFR